MISYHCVLLLTTYDRIDQKFRLINENVIEFLKETCEYNSINKTYVTMFKSLTLNMIVCNQRKNVIDFNK